MADVHEVLFTHAGGRNYAGTEPQACESIKEARVINLQGMSIEREKPQLEKMHDYLESRNRDGAQSTLKVGEEIRAMAADKHELFDAVASI